VLRSERLVQFFSRNSSGRYDFVTFIACLRSANQPHHYFRPIRDSSTCLADGLLGSRGNLMFGSGTVQRIKSGMAARRRLPETSRASSFD
jgi:hypothetical protein